MKWYIHYHDHNCLSFDLKNSFFILHQNNQNVNLELNNVGGAVGACREITLNMCDGLPTTEYNHNIYLVFKLCLRPMHWKSSACQYNFFHVLWVLSTTKYRDKNNGMMKEQSSNDEQNEEKNTCPDQG